MWTKLQMYVRNESGTIPQNDVAYWIYGESGLSAEEPTHWDGTLAGRRGTKAIQAALESLDLGALEKVDKAAIVRAKRNRRDEAVRRLSFVSGLRKSGLSPADLMITKVPVLPPTVRPVSAVGGMLKCAKILDQGIRDKHPKDREARTLQQ